MRSTYVVILLVLTLAAPAAADGMRCTFQSRQVCDPSGCTPGDPASTFVLLRLDEQQYGRCDGKRSCDWYPMRVQQGGNYLNLDFANGVQGAKLNLNGHTFIETVSVMDRVLISFGRCQP